jgi:uncharacterized membrane protein YoaK (UPF0700 family)
VIFAISGLLLQIGVTLLENPAWASAANVAFAVVLFTALATTQDIMHPASPIFSSGSARIQVFFVTLLILTIILAGQVALLWLRLERVKVPTFQPYEVPTP